MDSGAFNDRVPVEILQRYVTGDMEAFEHVFRVFQPQVYAWIIRLTRDPASADELTVEAFWKMYRAHARFDVTRSFGAWARRIASNVALDYLRRERRNRPALVDPIVDTPPSSAQRDLHLRVERIFLGLPPKLRLVAELALIDGCPQEEVAAALGLSRSAVKARVFRATRYLKEAFRREGIEP